MRAIGRAYELSAEELSRITGIEAGDLARTDGAEGRDTLTTNQTQAVLQLLELHDGLSAIFGEHDSEAANWLRTRNIDLDAKPVELIATTDGLKAVSEYVAAYRSKS